MKPSQHLSHRSFPWRILALGLVFTLLGCTSPLMLYTSNDEVAELPEMDLETDDSVTLIREVSVPWGMNFLKLEGVALVTGLDRTGSDPSPSALRTELVSDMQTYEVKKPNLVLSSDETSMVLVRAYLPPGVQKGDRFDVEVRVPSESESTSLENGWLMRARLREVALMQDAAIHSGQVEALAKGPVVINAVFDGSSDEIKMVHGRVLGGGVALESRPIGLVVRSENHSIKTASLIGAAINGRFHTYDRGVKRGVATPKRDNFVVMDVHPRYKHNLGRYVRVIQNIALGESATERIRRIETLERKLLDPATAPTAALQLEAIGKEAISVMEKGLKSDDPEVRFYAAEALGYMDEASASEHLAEAAREEPTLRWHAIAALSAMDHISAYDALADLLHVPSAETRYAAFRALRARNPLDSLVRGAAMGDSFTYHVVDTSGPSMIHFSRSRVPELVVFGQDVRLHEVDFLYAGKNIMLKSSGPDRIEVLRFDVGEDNKRKECSSRLDDVVRTIVDMGGGYADVLLCLNEAKRKDYLEPRIVVDALPRARRTRRKRDDHTDEAEQDQNEAPTTATPLPDIFHNRSADGNEEQDEFEMMDIDPPDEEEEAGFFRSLGEWF